MRSFSKLKDELLVKVETDGWIKIPRGILEKLEIPDGAHLSIKILGGLHPYIKLDRTLLESELFPEPEDPDQ